MAISSDNSSFSNASSGGNGGATEEKKSAVAARDALSLSLEPTAKNNGNNDDIPAVYEDLPNNLSHLQELLKNPGDLIRAEDWNKIVYELIQIRSSIDGLSENRDIKSLSSPIGRGYALDAKDFPGLSYGSRAVGLITQQWLPSTPEIGEICDFGLAQPFSELSFWAAADNGDKNALDVIFEYVDGTQYKAGEKLYVNRKDALSPRDPSNKNPYSQFLRAPYGYFYKYTLANEFPDKEVRYIKFINVDRDCTPRIGNVVQLKVKVRISQKVNEK